MNDGLPFPIGTEQAPHESDEDSRDPGDVRGGQARLPQLAGMGGGFVPG
ncbi:hypothetical protein ABT236_24310 [Streptomyces sp. NPDC001523]